jgi:hypothetical protein
MATDYSKLAKNIKQIVDDVGVTRGEVQQLFGSDGKNAEVKQAMDEVDKLTKALGDAMANPITAEEQQRKLEDLDARIKLVEITRATDPDFQDRIEAEHDLTVLNAIKATYVESTVLQFGDLIDEDNHSLKSLLEEAQKDIAARQDLQRVLKGIEVVLRVGAFSGAVAAKLAIAAAK